MDQDSLRKDFLDMASLMTADYFMSPLNHTKELKTLIENTQVKLLAEAKEKGINIDGDRNAYEGHLSDGKKQAIRLMGTKCVEEGRRCPHELAEIDKLFDIFSDKYDLNDARAYVIFKSLVSNMLSAFRLQRYSQEKGSMLTQYTKDGSPYVVVNPAEEAKRKFNESLVTAISRLDAIFEGQKINAQIENKYKPRDFIDLFAKKVMEPEETAEIEYEDEE